MNTFQPRRPRPEQTRLVFLVLAAIAVIVAVAVVVLVSTQSNHAGPRPGVEAGATLSAADRHAPESLIAAANAVHFYPTYEPGVGVIENKPASAALPPENPGLLPVGSVAPAFALKTPQGQRVSLSQFRGKAVLLEFFATWCPHCNAEAPHLRKLYASLPRMTYAFVSVNADGETAPSVFAFHRYYGLQYPALVDPGPVAGSFSREGAPGKVTTAYRVEAFPTFYVIDPEGRITWRSDGEQPDALLADELHQAAKRV